MGKARLEAFSDGVIAILITIMVLELHMPAGADLASLKPVVPGLLAYVLSRAEFPLSPATTPGGVVDVTRTLGQLLMGTFILPFEIAGVLLLAAMIGAIVIARES